MSRLDQLLAQNAVTGIDFVHLEPHGVDPRVWVYFHKNPSALALALPQETVRIEAAGSGAVLPLASAPLLQTEADGREVLKLHVADPGSFERFRLRIVDLLDPTTLHPRVDPFFNDVEFSFQQNCPTDFDCKPRPPRCPPSGGLDFPVDYGARDFWSLRSALLDYAAQRHPEWKEPGVEADVGTMVLELFCAVGDELAWIQDMHGLEARFGTATQRRSFRHHTRLVDYRIHDGLSATTLLVLGLAPQAGPIAPPWGGRVYASNRIDGVPIAFELGRGLHGGEAEFPLHPNLLHPSWNRVDAFVPDPGDEDDPLPCTAVGATEIFVAGTVPSAAELPPGSDPRTAWVGRWILLRSDPPDPGDPARRWFVRVTEVEHLSDGLGGGTLTRIQWEPAQALPFQLPLPHTSIQGNVVPAIAGETLERYFTAGDLPFPSYVDRTVRRESAHMQRPDGRVARAVQHLFSLPETDVLGLGFVVPDRVAPTVLVDPTPDAPLREAWPELVLEAFDPAQVQDDPAANPPNGARWAWRPDLLDSRADDAHFTHEHGTWRTIRTFQRGGELLEHRDHQSARGFTVRFGHGQFGRDPERGGASPVFRARYRVGPGSRANVPADTATLLEHPDTGITNLPPAIVAATNPIAVTSGRDPETLDEIRQLAPEAFRAFAHRAVRPEDYAEIVSRLPWVQRASARFRWTGSWHTAFVTPDPVGSFALAPAQRASVEELVDCIRQAGRETTVAGPDYLDVDLRITICIRPTAYAGQVKEAVLQRLSPGRALPGSDAFFAPDHFSFGTPLLRSALEAAVQAVEGVLSVDGLEIRPRGRTRWRSFDELALEVGAHQILRCQDDPRFPSRGSLRIQTVQELAA